uniref:Ricin-type beta-trefoil lectin domain/F5/8 type C domain/LCCL domain containing protein, putative n=1 Tax=Theileria annulata TaxID=5874 RepID=A0A3B0NBX7_THEAN
MRLYNIKIILFLIFVKKIGCRNANEFYTFKDSKATSVFIAPNNDSEKHGPNRAFQIGSSYWSSQGHHSDTDFVSWTGELYEKATISQINVFWEYAPKEVEISLSLTGDDFNVVMPFRPTFENKRSYKENFKLEMPYETKFVRLTLRGAINTYFGIRHIHLVGYGTPLFMIKSGISSKEGEMCLQVEEGTVENQPRVVLDLCVNAIAASDGRELWRQNSRMQIVSAVSYPEKCLTTVESSKVGPVIIDNCNEDSCTWEFMGNSQLSVKNANELCLTQKDENGNVAGMGNLVEKYKSELKVTSTGSSEKHEEKYAVDLDKKTYWASLIFPDDGYHVTSLTLDFDKMVHASRVLIDWEYQPLSYTIEASSDKITFKEISRNLSNSYHTTTDSFPGTDFKQLRIVMMKPHYLHGKVSGGYVYGIRDLSVLTNNLLTVVGDCRAAANSADARDKYFVSYVSVFEPLLSKKVRGMESDLNSVITEVSNELSHLKESLEESANCMDEKKDYDNQLNLASKKSQDLWKLFNTSTITKCDPYTLELSVIGENKNNPAEDCYNMYNLNPNVKSGFYWIQPPCSKAPLRVYCDMDSHTSMYIWNGKDNSISIQPLNNIRTPTSLRFQCASYGLEPLVIKSRRQIDHLKKAMKLMPLTNKLDSYLPLAYKFGSEPKFKDFMNIFSFISFPHANSVVENSSYDESNHDKFSESSELVDLHVNAVGISMSTQEIERFDLETSDISGIACSTNVTDEITAPLELDCSDSLGKSKKIFGSLNTSVIVRCDEDCSQKENLFIYGTNGLYSDHSSVCLAAIHAGIISSHGSFVVSIENGMKYYDGDKQNGVQSYFYNKTWHGLKDIIHENETNGENKDNFEHNGPDRKYSIRILPREKLCPIVETKGSFLQLNNNTNTTETVNAVNPTDKVNNDNTNATTKNNNNDNVENGETIGDTVYDPNTVKYANKVIEIMDSLYGVDNKTVTNVVEQISVVVSQAKKHLRSLEPIHNKQNDTITSLFDNGGSLSSRVHSYYDTLDSSKMLYSNLLTDEKNKTIDVSSDFELDYHKMPFSKTFTVHDSSMANGKSNWGYSNSPVEGHDSYVAQSGDLDSELIAEGSFAFLNHFKYFDFEISLDVLATNEGSIGLAFRVHDQFNFYLFVMNYFKSNKQLIKVEDGVAYVLATNPDEGYNKMHWYNLKVNCTHYYTEVHCDNRLIFRVIDTSFLYGSFGLYSSGSNGSFYFDNLSIKAKNVKLLESPLRIERLKHIKCCNFSETCTGSFQENYNIINPKYSINTDWSFEKLFNGEHKVIHQVKACYDPHDIGSLAILKNDRYCSGGFFRFRVLPQCESGTVGAVVHYLDEKNMCLVEINSKEFRIRQFSSGVVKVLASEEASISISKWNVIEIELTATEIKARAKTNVPHNFILKSLLSSYDFKVSATIEPNKGNSLGLKSSACSSCYFDSLQISHSEPKELNTNFMETSVSAAWAPCLASNLLERRRLCSLMTRNNALDECMCDFCNQCCSHHTRLLGDHVTLKCTKKCDKNNLLFKINSGKFNSYLSACTSFQGPAFSHCNLDPNCLFHSCKLCCNSGYYNQFDDKRKLIESTYCENKCKILKIHA